MNTFAVGNNSMITYLQAIYKSATSWLMYGIRSSITTNNGT